MAGSPIKRARKKARQLAGATTQAAGGDQNLAATAVPAPLPAPIPALQGEILPPADDDGAEATRTAKKRAMRRKAEEYAERAMEVLAKAMESADPRISVPAAKEILDRAIGKPTQELEVGANGVAVTIVRFGDDANR